MHLGKNNKLPTIEVAWPTSAKPRVIKTLDASGMSIGKRKHPPIVALTPFNQSKNTLASARTEARAKYACEPVDQGSADVLTERKLRSKFVVVAATAKPGAGAEQCTINRGDAGHEPAAN